MANVRESLSRGNVLKEHTGPVGILETVADLQEIRSDSKEGDGPGCRQHKDTWSRLEDGRMEGKNKHRQTINLIRTSRV